MKKETFTAALFASTCTWLLAAGAAHASNVDADALAADEGAQQGDAVSADDVQEDPQGEGSAIIVTAQRRDERLTDVPISVSAISSESLETQQIQTTLDLPKSVSGMTVSHNGLWVTPAIRGIGSRVGENSVAQYVDGVYIANPVTALAEFAAVASGILQNH